MYEREALVSQTPAKEGAVTHGPAGEYWAGGCLVDAGTLPPCADIGWARCSCSSAPAAAP